MPMMQQDSSNNPDCILHMNISEPHLDNNAASSDVKNPDTMDIYNDLLVSLEQVKSAIKSAASSKENMRQVIKNATDTSWVHAKTKFDKLQAARASTSDEYNLEKILDICNDALNLLVIQSRQEEEICKKLNEQGEKLTLVKNNLTPTFVGVALRASLDIASRNILESAFRITDLALIREISTDYKSYFTTRKYAIDLSTLVEYVRRLRVARDSSAGSPYFALRAVGAPDQAEHPFSTIRNVNAICSGGQVSDDIIKNIDSLRTRYVTSDLCDKVFPLLSRSAFTKPLEVSPGISLSANLVRRSINSRKSSRTKSPSSGYKGDFRALKDALQHLATYLVKTQAEAKGSENPDKNELRDGQKPKESDKNRDAQLIAKREEIMTILYNRILNLNNLNSEDSENFSFDQFLEIQTVAVQEAFEIFDFLIRSSDLIHLVTDTHHNSAQIPGAKLRLKEEIFGIFSGSLLLSRIMEDHSARSKGVESTLKEFRQEYYDRVFEVNKALGRQDADFTTTAKSLYDHLVYDLFYQDSSKPVEAELGYARLINQAQTNKHGLDALCHHVKGEIPDMNGEINNPTNIEFKYPFVVEKEKGWIEKDEVTEKKMHRDRHLSFCGMPIYPDKRHICDGLIRDVEALMVHDRVLSMLKTKEGRIPLLNLLRRSSYKTVDDEHSTLQESAHSVPDTDICRELFDEGHRYVMEQAGLISQGTNPFYRMSKALKTDDNTVVRLEVARRSFEIDILAYKPVGPDLPNVIRTAIKTEKAKP